VKKKRRRAVADAKAVPERVQGYTSDLDDLTLRDGRSFAVEIGGSLVPTPSLKRTIGGGSTISLEVEDEALGLLDVALISESWSADLDGLDFAYLGTKKAGTRFSIGLEEEAIARLRKMKGPKKVAAHRGQENEMTRAEFVISLVEEVPGPPIPWYCPQLHEKQPIESRDQGTKAKADAKANREGGIGDVEGLTVKGVAATKEQIDAGDRAIRAAESHGAEEAVILALLISLFVESLLGKISSNWLQIEPESVSGFSGDPTNLEESVKGFLLGYEPTAPAAIEYYRQHPDAKPYEIAQAVQRSRAGLASNGAANYGPWIDEAREWIEAYGGGGGGGSASETITETQTFYFEVEKDETYWDAIKRLAKDVNWRAFFVAGRFFYIDEHELARGMVRLAVKREKGQRHPSTRGVEDVDFDYNGNKPITSATLTVQAKEWAVPPGGVVTVTGYGPASLGFGEPPLRRGQKTALSNARNAVTKAGTGRYLVESIEGPLTGDTDARLLTVKIRKPTAPLPEPANETRSREVGGDDEEATPSGEADQRVQAVLDYCERSIGKPYVWGTYDCSAFVSFALEAGDFLSGRLTTSGFVSWGEAGEGKFITVHDKAGTGNPRTEHVIIEVLGRFFECGGISGGVGEPDYSASELAGFSTKRHPKGY
jgi:cell wall-associated NlpC family hydrolase